MNNFNSIKLTASYSISLETLTKEVPILSKKKIHFLVFKITESIEFISYNHALYPYDPF